MISWSPAPLQRMRYVTLRYGALCYAVLLALVLVGFDNATMLSGVLFVLLNFAIATVFVGAIRSNADSLFSDLTYAVYSLVYIFKGILLNVMGLNTAYIYVTIRTNIGPEDYISALDVVTLGHALLVGLLGVLSRLPRTGFRDLRAKIYLSDRTTNLALVLLFVWIVASSVIMKIFGVAVMGTEGVSLPYKLSGVFFYSRTLIVPLLLLYFIEKSLVRQNRTLFLYTLSIFILLIFSEVIIRASKGPLLHMSLYLGVLLYLLLLRGCDARQMISRKLIISLIAVAVVAFPLTEIYRSVVVVADFDTSRFMLGLENYMMSSSHQGGNFLVIAVERLFHRLVGFTQTAGVIAIGHSPQGLFTVLEYGSIAQYYTEGVLGYHIIGHSSSPSLLGAALMLGGMQFWSLFFAPYILLMFFVWRFSSRFANLELPMKCLLGYEIFNTIVAGTVDASLFRMSIVFSFALFFEFFVSAVARQKVGRPPRHARVVGHYQK